MSQDDVRHECDQFRRVSASPLRITRAPADVNASIAFVGPVQLCQRLCERQEAGLSCRIVCRETHEYANAPHALALLRARRERPSGNRTAKQRDELAPPHSITSSAVPRRLAGSSIPRVFAVLRLITSWNLVGACTGRPAIFSPLRRRSTYRAAPWNCSIRSGPYEIKPPSVTLKRSE